MLHPDALATLRAFRQELYDDGLDRLVKSRLANQDKTRWTTTTFAYDRNGNVTERGDDGEEALDGTLLLAPRRSTFAYDRSGRPTVQEDLADGRRIEYGFAPTGWPTLRRVLLGGALQATSTWDAFANGQPRTLRTTNAAGAVLEEHALAYTDAADVYTGFRTRDTFTLQGPGGSPVCSGCQVAFGYDAWGRLTSASGSRDSRDSRDSRGSSGSSTSSGSYTLDALGNGRREQRTGAQSRDRSFGYTVDRLDWEAEGAPGSPISRRSWYGADGLIDCVTTGAGLPTDCSPAWGAPGVPNLLEDYAFNDLDRMVSYRGYDGTTGAETASSVWSHDARGRPIEETTRQGGPARAAPPVAAAPLGPRAAAPARTRG